jgi:hypothetical protein
MEIHSAGVELIHADGRTGGKTRDEADSRFSQICERA